MMSIKSSTSSNFRKRFRKPKLSLVVAVILGYRLLISSPALGAPQGGVVTSGNAAISQAGNVTNVNQSTGRASINWQSFSTKPQETVNFNQPNASSITLNRVIGNEKSVLQGALNATGKVFLLNSNGVLMTKGSTVNTAGFLAGTLNITDDDFNAGNYVFKANGSTGSVINMGTITARDGGYVALLGNSVSNQGVITATRGTVSLNSGNKITLNFNGDSLVNVTIDEGTLNGLVENKQAIYADGGKVILTAKAADDLLGSQVNNSGLIQARTIGDLKGNIELYAHGGTAHVDGTIDASAPIHGDGGFIETSGDHVKIADSAVITTKSAHGQSGDWLIDPDGYTIGSGGDMSGAALTAALGNGSVTIASTSGKGTDGNINVNDAVSWSANTLTLNATNNIFVNSVMTATGTAGLAANYGTGTNSDGTPMGLYTYQGVPNNTVATLTFAGKIDFNASGGVMLNGTNYTVLNTMDGLAAATANGNYVLGSNIAWNTATPLSGVIGSSTPFTGKLNGFGHLITSPVLSAKGLFGTIDSGATVSNLGITGAKINAAADTSTTLPAVGVLANYNRGAIINSFVATAVSAGTVLNNSNIASIGGLVGNNSGLIAQSYTYNITINALDIAGGLVGTNEAGGIILDSSARNAPGGSGVIANSSTATAISSVGGLAGVNHGNIRLSYSTLPILLTDSTSTAGSFVGLNTGTIDQCYASNLANATQYSAAPHLAGFVWDNRGTITNAYTTALYSNGANISAWSKWDAGFAYYNSGTISDAYATTCSTNTLNSARSGFVYDNSGGTITDAYWFANISGGTAVTGTPSATQLANATVASAYSSYSGFSPSIWAASKTGYPILKNQLVYIISDPASVITYGTAIPTNIYSLRLLAAGLQGGGGLNASLDTVGNQTRSPFTVLAENGYVNAGNWDAGDILTSSIYTNVTGTVRIIPKTLTASGVTTVADKIYDGTVAATVSNSAVTLSGLVTGQTLNVAASAAFSDKNAGDNKTVTVTYATSDGTGKASNYTLLPTTTTTASIAKKPLSAAVTGTEKVYDGTLDATAAVTWSLPGAIAGDGLTLTYAAAFADTNAGTGKTVTVTPASLSGTDSGNYTLNTAPLTTTAAITPKVLDLYAFANDGSTTVNGANIRAANILAGDAVTLGGTVTTAAMTPGITQQITDTTALTVSNPNYTVVGSVVRVASGSTSLVLDHVVSGTANIDTSIPNTTTITTSDKTAIDWLSFSLAAGTTLEFKQPSSSSIVLNRVTTDLNSVISGALNANGRVFILNSNGILFAAGSSVNTAGLVASALHLSDDNFTNNNYLFTAAGNTGSVVAAGDIVIVDGGFVALTGNNGVTTSGSLTAHGGTALLASADQVTLTLNTADSGLGSYAVAGLNGTTTVGGSLNLASAGGPGGLLETAGNTIAVASDLALDTGSNGAWSWNQNGALSIGNGGTVTGAFVDSNLAARNLILNTFGGGITVNDELTWSADTKLTLNAAGGDIAVDKAVTTTGVNGGLALNATGGDIVVNAPISANAALTLNAGNGIDINGSITAGNNAGLLFTAGNDITINADIAGSYAGLTLTAGKGITVNKGINAMAANAALTLNSGDDITINNAITTSGADAALALNAGKNITINANISATGTNAGLAMNYGGDYSILTRASYSGTVLDAKGSPVADRAPAGTEYAGITLNGANARLAINGTAYTLIHSMGELAALDDATGTASGYFALAGNLDASGITYTGAPLAKLSGTLAGLGNTVNNLTIHSPLPESSEEYFAGLIGQTLAGSAIRDIGVVNASIAGGGGILAGKVTGTAVSHAYSTGSISNGGGLLAYVQNSVISDSYSDARVSSGSGLIGRTDSTSVVRSHATGNALDGGLIGAAYDTTITNSYATGNVGQVEARPVGGLVGVMVGTSAVKNSYATGNVIGVTRLGGLIGEVTGSLAIDNSYATGNVTAKKSVLNPGSSAADGIGGLVGYVDNSGSGPITISNSHATGHVTAENPFVLYAGGLVGWFNSGKVSGSITNSYATGNVTVASTSGLGAVGGLVGSLYGANVAGSHATGDVVGNGLVGGIAGFMSSGNTPATINDSYSSGTVTATGPHSSVGGLVGSGTATGGNNYWNAASNSRAMGLGPDGAGKDNLTNANGNKGLNPDQFPEIDHYLDRTIDPILEARAIADAAIRQADAVDVARQTLGHSAQENRKHPAGQAIVVEQHPTSSDSLIVYAASVGSADIDSINADGVNYDLHDESREKKK